MSGGKDRKRSSKAQGWEEAGAEFYQESFPADLDNAIQRDPTAITTLLPSKQRAATTRRVRAGQQDTKSTRRRTHTAQRRNSTARRGSQYHDVQVSMLPDLSEKIDNEADIWEEINEIKLMPVSMAQKKEMKAQLQNATSLRLQGFEHIKWQRRKAWQRIVGKIREFLGKMELWRNSLKTIEGNFGTGVVAYFLFLRWLMFLNLIIFLLIFSFIVLPQIILIEPDDIPCDRTDSMMINSTQCCADSYFNETPVNPFSILDIIQGTGFMERTIMFYGVYTNKIFGYHPLRSINQQILSVIHNYSNNDLQINDNINNNNNNNNSNNNSNISNNSFYDFTRQANDGDYANQQQNELFYDLPLAYVSVSAVYFLISLAAIVKAASHGFKERLIEGEGQFYQYCNLVFGGWDFCIHNEKSAIIKHKALYNEITGLLQAKRMEHERHNRTSDVMLKLIAIRLIINLFVICILISAAFLVYVLFAITLNYLYPDMEVDSIFGRIISSSSISSSSSSSNSYSNSFSNHNINNTSSSVSLTLPSISLIRADELNDSTITLDQQLTGLFYEFLPYIAIVILNLVVPILFNYLVQFEKYSPMFVIKITLYRTVSLRLFSLIVLLSRFYLLVRNDLDDNVCFNAKNGTPQCWETFVGQQFYKLFIVDFATQLLVTFFINFPRAIVARHVENKIIKFMGEQEFELSKHVLDIIYSQTLCWLGSFYAPFLPAIAVVLHFFMFYIKKFACLVNSKPSAILYRASRTNSTFMFLLLLSFVVAVVPVVYAVAEILPSRSCGPFRGLDSVWIAAIDAFMKLPAFFQNLIFFFGTAGFAIPCLVLLTLFLYYYYAVSAANKHMVEVLKNQLVLEGHDKQFLLNRLNSFLKAQDDYRKKLRQAELRSQREREREQMQQQQQQQQQQQSSQQEPPLPYRDRSSNRDTKDNE